MSNTAQVAPTSKDIQNLNQAIGLLPIEYQELLQPHVEKVAETQNRRYRLNKMIQEALTQLRLDIKYLEFDLHATRTERDEYKSELEAGESFGDYE